jgi:hypothetical protein
MTLALRTTGATLLLALAQGVVAAVSAKEQVGASRCEGAA